MNFDNYFKLRADLALRILIEVPAAASPEGGWRFFSAGVACLAAAIAGQLAVAGLQSDTGYFLVVSAFLKLTLFSGLGLIMAALVSEYALARHSITARETVKQKTVAQLLELDGAVAVKLAERGGGR